MLIDCAACEVRGPACSDCVVSVLLGVPDGGAELDPAEQVAIGTLAEAGLVPPLRLVVPDEPAGAPSATSRPSRRSDDGDTKMRRAGHLPRAQSAG